MVSLQGKIAFVTGGRQGIGRAIVDAYLAQNAAVMTCGRGTRPDDLPDTCEWFQVDVSKSVEVNQCADEIGKLDIVVNNSGVQVEKTVADTTDEDWHHLMGVNARGVFNVCRAFIPQMNKSGSIINIGSISGNNADHGMAVYNASKAFVHGLTRSIAVDHGPDIRCNAIAPGWIMTDMAEAGFAMAKSPNAAQTDALNRHPVGRFGIPEDIASMAVWLAGDASSFASGQIFTIDGGMTAASPLNPGLF